MLPGAEQIDLPGAGARVLLCHGFTSTPSSLSVWANGLNAAGYRVSVPRLPGHGTRWQDLNRTTWRDWYATVETELSRLATEPGGQDGVFVGGLSMGGTLALRLAEQHPDLVRGLMLVNPAVVLDDPRLATLPALRWIVPSLPGLINDTAKPGVDEGGYRRNPLHALHSVVKFCRLVEADLPTVTAPAIVLRSAVDHVVPVRSPLHVLARIRSTDVEDVPLLESYHVATLDYDAQRIVDRSAAFIARLTGEAAPATDPVADQATTGGAPHR